MNYSNLTEWLDNFGNTVILTVGPSGSGKTYLLLESEKEHGRILKTLEKMLSSAYAKHYKFIITSKTFLGSIVLNDKLESQ
jgi:ABC-type lipoprotein export system ATPase subunit